MKRTETKIGGKPIRMTALAFAAAQVAMLYSYGAQAQTTDTTATADSGTTTVVVTGQRRALETAQRIKQEAEQVVDSVVADEAGKLPDKSITEVLQRVVGVTMDRNRSRSNNSPLGGDSLAFSAEGSGVQVRGLSWGSSTLNGRESFSAGWPGRELSWSDVPPELMAAVDVYKNPSSELVEGGISSQINLRTRLPFDQKGAMGALSMSDNYTALGKKNSPAVSGLYSNRWNTRYGEFGALVDLSYNKFKSRFDSVGLSAYYPRTNDVVPGKTVWVPDNTSWGTGEGVSERKGFYGALQWKKDNFETALTYFDSDYNQTDENHSIFATGAYAYDTKYSNAKFDNRGVFQSGTLTYPAGQGLNQFAAGGLNMGTSANLSHVGARTRELAWNVKWRANESWVFQNDLQWVHATNHADGALVNLSTFVPSMNMDVRLDAEDHVRSGGHEVPGRSEQLYLGFGPARPQPGQGRPVCMEGRCQVHVRPSGTARPAFRRARDGTLVDQAECHGRHLDIDRGTLGHHDDQGAGNTADAGRHEREQAERPLPE